MFGEALLPNFAPADFDSHRVRVSSLDELHRALQGNVIRRRKQQVDMVRHQHEHMQLETSLLTISIKSLQEKAGVRFHDEESSSLKCRESHEVSSRGRYQSSRFHRRWPSAAQSRDLLQPNAVRLKVAPFPIGSFRVFPRWERAACPIPAAPFATRASPERSKKGEDSEFYTLEEKSDESVSICRWPSAAKAAIYPA